MKKRPLVSIARRKVLHARSKPAPDLKPAGEHPDSIPLPEFMQRRERLLKQLGQSVGLIFSGNAEHERYEANADFVYLTGITTEPGAVLLFDPTHEDPSRRVVLCLRPLNPELDRWDGLREELSASLRSKLGFRTVLRTSHLPLALAAAARRNKALSCLHPFATHIAPVSEDLAMFRKVTERTVGVHIEDRTGLLPAMRSVKSRSEIMLIQRAIDITAQGFAAAMRSLHPHVGEGKIQRILESTYAEHGGQGLAFGSIVGSGLNGTVLHYRDNSADTLPGDLVVIDSGAKFGGYCADITRTLPVSGRFTREHRAIYEVVLMAQEAAIAACRPGARLHEVDAAARAVIERAGLADFFVHGIGHHLGIQVHDATPLTPLEPGHVITIEPGVYIPARKLGIRIEDDVLITSRGHQVLSSAIPKTADDIERAMADR